MGTLVKTGRVRLRFPTVQVEGSEDRTDPLVQEKQINRSRPRGPLSQWGSLVSVEVGVGRPQFFSR